MDNRNKGFSLVELIVVFAIMAVLVGLLAPSLISIIERSRESKDYYNLDNVRQAMVTAMADDNIYKRVVPLTGEAVMQVTIAGGKLDFTAVQNVTSEDTTELKKEVETTLTGDRLMTSATAGASDVFVYVRVDNSGKVKALCSKDGEHPETARQLKDSNGNLMVFEIK